MHKPVVSKIRVKDPNKPSTKHSNKGNLHYIATRPGVVVVNGIPDMNEKQEDDFSKESTEKEYLQYIARRPRSHGLFGNIDTSNLAKLEAEMYELSKNRLVYRGITSLSEEDATELGYYSKKKWEQLLQATMPDIAAQFNIPIERLNWVGAFHLEQSHPHVHYMFWDSQEHVRSPFIHVSKQNKCRTIFSQEIFREEREKAAVEKTVKRDLVLELGEKYLSTNIDLLSSLFIEEPTNTTSKIPGYVDNLPLIQAFSEEIEDLIQSLPPQGRIAYGFLPPEVKQKVDAITDRLLTNNLDIRKEYLTYLDLAETTAKTYSPSAKNYSNADYKITNAITNADRDIRKRVCNLILKHAKQLRAENFSFPANLKEFFDNVERKDAVQMIPKTLEQEEEGEETALSLGSFFPSEEEQAESEATWVSNEDVFPFYEDESLFTAPPASPTAESPSSDAVLPFYEGDLAAPETEGSLLSEPVSSAPADPAPLQEPNTEPTPDSRQEIDPLQPSGKEPLPNGIPRKDSSNQLKPDSNGSKQAERNPKKAYPPYQKSVKKEAYAAYELAKSYETTTGTTANPVLAEEHYKKAFEKFSSLLQSNPDDKLYYRVGKMIYDGKGTAKSTADAIPYLEKAAELKNPEAQYLYAKILLERPGNSEKMLKAINYLKDAAEHNNTNAFYTLGKLYTDEKNPNYDLKKGLSYLEKASDEGNKFAQYRLGNLYQMKTLPVYNLDRAITYYQSAAENGHDAAETALGKLYMEPDLPVRNLKLALQYLNSAAEKGNVSAYGQLGKLYTDKVLSCFAIDEDTKKMLQTDGYPAVQTLCDQGLSIFDLKKGISYLKFAVEKQDPYAMYHLAKLCLDHSSPIYDEDAGLRYLKGSADKENVAAYYALGKLYTDKKSNYYNPEKGIEYLKKAAEKNPYAKYTLGTLLLDEKLLLPDPKTGLRYLTEAADCKESIAVNAQYALGKYFLQEGSEHYNQERGIYYLTMAANVKNSYAEYQLGIFFLKGAGQDRTLGLTHLKSSADSGNSIALFALGKEYLFGEERDVELGKSYFNLAIKQGNEYAKLLLDSYENMRREQILNGSFQILSSVFDEFEKTNRRQEAELTNYRKSISKQAAKELAKKLGQQKE